MSGGSVANSIVGLAQLGNSVGFIGKISDDELGAKYEEGLKKENVDIFFILRKRNNSYWYLFDFNYTGLGENYGNLSRHRW